MLYMVIGRDASNSGSSRQRVRAEHLARIQSLLESGRLVLAGPLPAIDAADPGPAGFFGSLIVAEFESLIEARQWAEADPYLIAGAWRETEVHPFLQVLP